MSQLTPLPIAPPPGVVLDDTYYASAGRWVASQNVRFVKGRPQKLGGNVSAVATQTNGTPRALHAWRDNNQNNYLAAGTYANLYVYDSSWVQNDITPIRASGTLVTNPLAVVSGSTTVTVTSAAHGLSIGDTAILAGSTAVGGITPNGSFQVASVPDANHYTFTFTAPATSTASGGGSAVTYQYVIPIGVELGVYGLGYGVGGYGLGTYGTARSVSTIYIVPRVWSLDHFGQLLMCSYNGGSIWQFDPTASQPWGRAVPIATDPALPTNCLAMFVTNERFIFALLTGMQLAWCSQGDPTTWTVAVSNTANVRTLTEGTKLVGGRVLSDFVALVWSDAALFYFQYTGSAYIYNSSMVAKDCGLIGPNAAVTAGGVAYWIGQDNLWLYNGSVMPLPNVEDVRSYIFNSTTGININLGYQSSAIYVATHNEVWFFWTIIGQTNPTVGMIFSIDNQCFAPLYFGRTAGTHFTQGDTRPYMGNSDFFIYQHENTNDNNGAIMPWSLQLAPYALNEGGVHMDIESFITDFQGQVGNITLTVSTQDRLNDTASEDSDTETIAPTNTGTIDLRVSGRYAGLLMECSSLGSFFRWGKPVAWIKPSGNRP